MTDRNRHLSRSSDLGLKVQQLLRKRLAVAQENFTGHVRTAWDTHGAAAVADTRTPWDFWRGAAEYATDFAQRSVLFWDTLRQRGNNWTWASPAPGSPRPMPAASRAARCTSTAA